MKKLRSLRLIGILSLLAVIAVLAIASTYARYTTSVNGTDSARVAHWDVNATNNVSDLFAASYSKVAAGTEEQGIIAPGTSGEYTFSITGSIETAYTLSIVATGTDNVNGAVSGYNPIKYSFKKNSETAKTDLTFQQLLDAINAIDDGSKEHAAGNLSADTYTIGWAWAIDGDNEKDTQLGKLVSTSEKTVSLSVNIAATKAT